LPFFLALLITLGWPPDDEETAMAPSEIKQRQRAQRQLAHLPAAAGDDGSAGDDWQPERWG
jgi:hypothetical protein